MVAARFIKSGDEMSATGTGRAGADGEPAGKLGLARGGERRAFLVTNADPFDLAAAHRVGERIERVADQRENLPDADLLKHADQNFRHCLRHRTLLFGNYTTGLTAAPGSEIALVPNRMPFASVPIAVRTTMTTATVPATAASASA